MNVWRAYLVADITLNFWVPKDHPPRRICVAHVTSSILESIRKLWDSEHLIIGYFTVLVTAAIAQRQELKVITVTAAKYICTKQKVKIEAAIQTDTRRVWQTADDCSACLSELHYFQSNLYQCDAS
jgi:hypothetical protein